MTNYKSQLGYFLRRLAALERMPDHERRPEWVGTAINVKRLVQKLPPNPGNIRLKQRFTSPKYQNLK